MSGARAIRWSLIAAIFAAAAFLQAAPLPVRLTAVPNPALVGQPVSFTPTLTTGTIPRTGQLYVDFGDGSARVTAQWGVPVVHAYAQPGQYTAQLLASAFTLQTIATTVVTVNGAAPVPRRSPVVPVLSVQSLSLSWPNGSTSLNLTGSMPPPQPLALVQTSGSGTLVIQWLLDGNAFSTATQQVSAAGNQRVALSTQLPNNGSHSISVRLISPPVALGAAPTPPPPITYVYAGAPPAPVGFYNGSSPVVKFAPISFTFIEGKIDLQTPHWGYNDHATCPGGIEVCNVYGTPMLDDSAFFSWQEENPGIADYFELHILDQSGRILAKKQLPDSTAYFTPDPAFLESALKNIYADEQRQSRVIATAFASDVATTLKLLRIRAGVSSLKWEVRGFKQYSQGSTTKTVEVEKSDLWPLGVPNDANGIDNCPTSAGGLQAVNLALQTSSSSRVKLFFMNFDSPAATQSGSTNITNYIDDPIVIEGNVDLSGSPYLSKPQTVNVESTPPPQGGYPSFAPPIKEVDFDNLFVDWGDGTVEPIRAVPAQGTSQGGSWIQRKPNAVSIALPVPANAGQNLNAAQFSDSNHVNVNMHRYTTTGTFTIRIFQLSESDVQHMSPSDIGSYVDASSIAQSNPYFHVAHISLAPKKQGSTQFPHFIGVLGGLTLVPIR